MKGFALGLSLSIAFILGCAAAFIVPRMSAQQAAAGVHAWEYACLATTIRGPRLADAEALGIEGWELVGESGKLGLCFKRPL